MPNRAVNPSNQESVFAYLDAVLNYYKTTENASLGEWPTYEIGWRADKNVSFYRLATQWFEERNVRIIRHHDTNRYLSTFILAAEFPPTLGYGRLVQELVRNSGWLSLYRSPETNLQEYINAIDINAYTVAQRQSFTLNSEGYTAFLQLIQILASIRYSLDNYENIDSVCAQISEKHEWDLDLVLRIAHSYKDILIPPQKSDNQDTAPSPNFSYQLCQEGMEWNLVLKHNLNKKIAIPHPSSITLPRYSSGTLSILSESENLSLSDGKQLVRVEVKEGFLEIECSFDNEIIPVHKRNTGLQKLQFMVTVKDTDARPHQLYLGQVKRNDPFLIFGNTGTEMLSNTFTYKKGDTLRVVPLSNTIGEFLLVSADFEQEEQTGMLPVFQTMNTQVPSIQLGKLSLQFCSIPFSIRLREQTAWESVFNRNRKVINYFFSPLLEMHLEGEFSEADKPTIEFYRRIKHANIEIHVPIPTVYENGKIIPIRPIPSPGQYTLNVRFGEDSPSSITFNLLPIRSIKLIGDKHIQLKMFSKVKDFQLQGTHTCNSTFNEGLVDIHCNDYGIQDIEAQYIYRNTENQTIQSPVKFRFEAVQEVVGHFRQTINLGTTENFSIERDLVANSYLEFRKTSLREMDKPYKVSAYMEYSTTNLRIFPECQVMHPDGSRLFSLASLVSYVKSNQFSRLLLIVEYDKHELYRIEFRSERRPIIDLEKEWNQGAYSRLMALPLYSLEPLYGLTFDTLPPNSLVYGMAANAAGKEEIATFSSYFGNGKLQGSGLAASFLSHCNEYMNPDEQTTKELMDILQSPEESFKLMKWLTKAAEWDYPYDVKVFAKLCDTFPLLVAWAELARNPENRTEEFALITPDAKRRARAGMYCYPNLKAVTNHPRFSPELLTIKDLDVLDTLNLMPKEAPPMKLFAFYCQPFISDGKPVLAWLTLFWLRRYCEKNGTIQNFKNCSFAAQNANIPIVTELAKEFTKELLTYNQDREQEQDFEKLLNEEQEHYINTPFDRIPGLRNFLDAIKKPAFSMALSAIIAQQPLLYAEPELRGFKTSTKWKCIIFLSLTAACKQLDKHPLIETLESLWTFHHKTYIYLLKWVTKHEETARIYNCYYEYWMQCFWGEEHV